MAKQVEQLEKEKKELQERLKNQEKKVRLRCFIGDIITHLCTGFSLSLSPQIDYFERAKRLEEIPLIKKAYEEQRIKDMELWELQEEERVRWKINYCTHIKSLPDSTNFFCCCRSVT